MTEPASSKRQLHRTTWIGIGLFLGTVLLFARAIPHGFVNYDDTRYVTANTYIQEPFSWESLRWAFGGNLELWQPLTWLSHMLDWTVYGDGAAGHHLTSVLWHALNATLAFVVLQRLTRAAWLSAFAAAAYAWHPLRVESVAWISERKDVMSGCFFLLTLWCYLGYGAARQTIAAGPESAGAPRPRPGWRVRYVATLACFAAGLMCKPTLVTVPFLLLAFDVWPLRRAQLEDGGCFRPAGWLAVVVEKLPFFVAAAVVGLITVRLQRAGGAFILPLPLLARIENVPVALVRYLAKLAWPAALSVAYPHPGWWPTAVVIGATVFVVAVALVAWRTRSTHPWILVGAVWYLVLLLPTIGILQVGFQSMADRYTYLPSLGALLAVIWTLHRWLRRWRAAWQGALAASVLLPLAVRTWQQQAVWRDSLTLFQHAVALTPSSAVAEAFLGYTLVSLNRADEALPHLDHALALDPRNEMAVWALAQASARAGRIEDAIRYFERDLELEPGNVDARYELALQQLRSGDLASAATNLRTVAAEEPEVIERNRQLAGAAAARGEAGAAAIRLRAGALMEPANADAQLAAGIALAAVHRDPEARQAFERALALKPDFAAAHAHLGLLFFNRGDSPAAATHLQRALELSPKLVAARVGMARIEEQLGHRAASDEHFRVALAEEPQSADVNRAWADTLARRRLFSEAVPYYRRAAELRPKDASMHAAFGYALFFAGDRSAAANEWRRALELDPKFPDLRERLDQLQSK